jgi:hypothetical protein
MDITRLIGKQEKRREYKTEVFQQILKQVHRRIEYGATCGDSYAIFTIPVYVVGYPLFDTTECSVYIIAELTKNGFFVQCYSNRFLYMSWAHVYEQYKEQQLLNQQNLIEFSTDSKSTVNAEGKVKKTNELILNQGSTGFSLLK